MDDSVVDSIWTGINTNNSYGQADYWWLRSPGLDYVNSGAYCVYSDGDGYNWSIDGSYGITLRPLVIATLRVLCAIMMAISTFMSVRIGVPAGIITFPS